MDAEHHQIERMGIEKIQYPVDLFELVADFDSVADEDFRAELLAEPGDDLIEFPIVVNTFVPFGGVGIPMIGKGYAGQSLFDGT